jgi:hypothetical protein
LKIERKAPMDDLPRSESHGHAEIDGRWIPPHIRRYGTPVDKTPCARNLAWLTEEWKRKAE